MAQLIFIPQPVRIIEAVAEKTLKEAVAQRFFGAGKAFEPIIQRQPRGGILRVQIGEEFKKGSHLQHAANIQNVCVFGPVKLH